MPVYKHVVLGLIFSKYISDSFENRYQELVDEGESFEEDKDEYTMENIFFAPKQARQRILYASRAVKALLEVIKPYKGRVFDIILQRLIQFNYPKSYCD